MGKSSEQMLKRLDGAIDNCIQKLNELDRDLDQINVQLQPLRTHVSHAEKEKQLMSIWIALIKES